MKFFFSKWILVMRDWSKLRNDEMRWEVCVVYWHAWWHYIPQTMAYSHVLYHIRQCCRMWYICQQKKMRTEQRAVLFTGSAKCAGERERDEVSLFFSMRSVTRTRGSRNGYNASHCLAEAPGTIIACRWS